MKVGARRQAAATFAKAVEVSSSADPDAENTTAAEMAGMVQLGSALGARTGERDAVTTHLSEAASLAERTGERNTKLQHFGPINVALWKVALAVGLGDGTAAAEAVEADPIPVALLGSPLRSANLSLDVARGWAQAGGDRDERATGLTPDAVGADLVALCGRPVLPLRLWIRVSVTAGTAGPPSRVRSG